MVQYDRTFDLKIKVNHCDVYFTVQWFCLISWSLFDVWTWQCRIMVLYDRVTHKSDPHFYKKKIGIFVMFWGSKGPNLLLNALFGPQIHALDSILPTVNIESGLKGFYTVCGGQHSKWCQSERQNQHVGQTHKENPTLVRIFYMNFTWIILFLLIIPRVLWDTTGNTAFW